MATYTICILGKNSLLNFLLGALGVGKSSLALRFVSKKFISSYDPTFEVF
jgi:AAA+ ATPase superfamily predicted ATPase